MPTNSIFSEEDLFLNQNNFKPRWIDSENASYKKIKFFIQVNLAEEEQKSGISLNEISNFYSFCTKELQLNIIGLMCLPPINSNAKEYFELLKKKADDLGLKELSMGMSGDFEDAISSGSTYLRLGTAILGQRNTK